MDSAGFEIVNLYNKLFTTTESRRNEIKRWPKDNEQTGQEHSSGDGQTLLQIV